MSDLHETDPPGPEEGASAQHESAGWLERRPPLPADGTPIGRDWVEYATWLEARVEYLAGAIRGYLLAQGRAPGNRDEAEVEASSRRLVEAASAAQFESDLDPGYDADQARADLRRIAAWLAEDVENQEAQGAAADLEAVATYVAELQAVLAAVVDDYDRRRSSRRGRLLLRLLRKT